MKYDKTVLVTGGAGFIGSTYLNYAVIKYPEYLFVNIDSLTAVSDLKNVTVEGNENYIFKQINICDASALTKLFAEYSITHIVHFAAESHVDVSIENPNIFIETNLVGTGNLLSLALEKNVGRFVHISTDEVYGSLSLEDNPFTENSTLAPNSPYSASKAGSDLLVRSYNKTFGLDVVTTRSSNNYGHLQDKTKFIPCAITALLNNKKIPVYGKGENIRDWLHVDDNVRAIDLVFHSGAVGEVYNIGGSDERQNIKTAELLASYAGKENAIEFVEDRKGHDFRYAIDSTKIQKLGWKPKVIFEDGLKETFMWYKNKHSGRANT